MSIAKIDRRAVLGAGAALGTTGLAAPALAQTKRFRMVTSWAPELPILPDSAQRVADQITLLSGGGLTFEVVHAGPDTHGEFDVLDLVRTGRADAYHSLEQNWQDRHPAYAFFTTVPFGLTADEMASWLRFGGGDTLWQELANSNSVHPMLVGNTSCQMGGWFAEKVESLEQLNGKKISIPGIGGKVWQAAGLDTQSLAGADLIPALFEGKIDALEWFNPHLDLDFGFAKLLPFYMFPGWQEPGDALAMGINLGRFEQLTPEEKALIEVACQQESVRVTGEFLAENGRSLNIMRREYGAQLEAFPPELLDRLFELTDQVLEEIAGHDELAGRIHGSFLDFRNATARYSDISSGKFVSLRNAALGLDKVYKYR
ncbi:MAG: hypothetical protein AAF415_06350 [Pseudomonadota bacterium]